jgi:hypothetical protein
VTARGAGGSSTDETAESSNRGTTDCLERRDRVMAALPQGIAALRLVHGVTSAATSSRGNVFAVDVQSTCLLVAAATHFLQPPLTVLLNRSVLASGKEPEQLSRLKRRLGISAFGSLTGLIVAFGVIGVVFHAELTDGAALGSTIAGTWAGFWAVRAALQQVLLWPVWPRHASGLRWHVLLTIIQLLETGLWGFSAFGSS